MSTTTRVSEFDRFGPWIDEVTDAEDVPRLFRDQVADPRAPRTVVVVPTYDEAEKRSLASICRKLAA